MIPAWKLQRELRRMRDQILGLPAALMALPARLREPARRKAWLRDFDLDCRQTAGALTLGGQVAVVLIYQPKGIPPSVLRTLAWLRGAGLVPFVVSNSPLRDEDRAQLLPHAGRLLERPNFGYDFGGYQDAIRLLTAEGLGQDRLVIMNDSVWLPMCEGLMDRVDARMADGADICGVLRDEKVRHDAAGGQPDMARFHLESYFYMFSARTIAHPAFQAYWRDYQMTDFKPDTIKRGEIGFSRAMDRAGLRLDALSDRARFLHEIGLRDDVFLRDTLRFAACDGADLCRENRRLLDLDPASPGWREAALEHIRRAVNRRRFNTTYPLANDAIFGTLFLKKSREPIFRLLRVQYLRAVDEGLITRPDEDVLAEIRATL